MHDEYRKLLKIRNLKKSEFRKKNNKNKFQETHVLYANFYFPLYKSKLAASSTIRKESLLPGQPAALPNLLPFLALAVKRGKIQLPDLVAKVCDNPRRILGLECARDTYPKCGKIFENRRV